MKHHKSLLFICRLLLSVLLFSACSNDNPDLTAPQAIPDNESIASINFSNYTHPSYCFTMSYPAGWKVEEYENSVTFNSPDGSGTIEIIIINTGFELDGNSFINFIDASENNWFGTYANYLEISRDDDLENNRSIRIKTLDWNKIPQQVISVYQKLGEVVYWQNFWENEASIISHESIFNEVRNSLSFKPVYCEDFPPYNVTMPFSGPYGLFSMQVPIQWIHTSEKGNVYQIDTFFSPDSKAAIQNIAYDDGKIITRGTADNIALDFLKEIYTKDVLISESRTQSDNSIRWVWKSISGDFQGTTFYETRGTSFLMLTVMVANDQKETYTSPLDVAISSYTIPQ